MISELKDKREGDMSEKGGNNIDTLPFKSVNHDLRKYGPMLRGRVCIVEGAISAGKSTAGRELEKFVTNLGIKCKFFPEPLIPDLLGLFLSDQKKYAFAFQLTMLVKRQAIYREAFEAAKQGYFCIIDRSIHGDYCFALMHKNRGNISDKPVAALSSTGNEEPFHVCIDGVQYRGGPWKFCPECGVSLKSIKDQSKGNEIKTPTEWESYLSVLHNEQFDHPDFVLYLEVTPDTAIDRCRIRDRDGEKSYDKAYFTELGQVYSSVIPASPANQILVIDWNKDRQISTIAKYLLEEMRKAYESNVTL